jgi:TPR repeat protein
MPTGIVLFFFSQSYFQIAARLSNADAQQELGFCYLNGRGCKKDRNEMVPRSCEIQSNAFSTGCAEANLVGLLKA